MREKENKEREKNNEREGNRRQMRQRGEKVKKSEKEIERDKKRNTERGTDRQKDGHTQRDTHKETHTEREKDRLREKMLHKLATLFSLLAEIKGARTVHLYMYTVTARFLQKRKHVHACSITVTYMWHDTPLFHGIPLFLTRGFSFVCSATRRESNSLTIATRIRLPTQSPYPLPELVYEA